MWVEIGGTWVDIWRNCESSLQGERERGVGEEGKGREANEAERGERDLPFAQNKQERHGFARKCRQRAYCRLAPLVSQPPCSLSLSLSLSSFFFFFLFSFLLVPGFTCQTELFTLCDKQASKQKQLLHYSSSEPVATAASASPEAAGAPDSTACKI
jgi:hypothetical protein